MQRTGTPPPTAPGCKLRASPRRGVSLQSRRRLVTILTLLAAGGVLAAAWAWPVAVLTVRLPRRDYALAAAVMVDPADRLVLSYYHSVEKTLVQGVFGFDPPHGLVALQTRMASVGTGLPNTARQHRGRAGLTVVDEKRRPLPGIRFFLSPINHTRLTVGGRQLPLEALPPGSLLFIDLEPTTLGRYLLWRAGGPAWTRQGDEP